MGKAIAFAVLIFAVWQMAQATPYFRDVPKPQVAAERPVQPPKPPERAAVPPVAPPRTEQSIPRPQARASYPNVIHEHGHHFVKVYEGNNKAVHVCTICGLRRFAEWGER